MITQSQLRELLDYDAETGVFTWRKNRCGRALAGSAAGSLTSDGYCRINILGKVWKAHRLAWFYVHGELPTGQIDHIDGDRLNNRIDNLRDVSQSINQQNRRKARSDNKIGLLGVCMHVRGWMARIRQNGKLRYIGIFPTPEQAHAAYLAAKREIHPGFVGTD